MKSIKNFLFQMLSAKGTISSMRVGFLSIILMAAVLIGCIAIYMIKKTWQADGLIDWTGISIMLGAIGVFISPVVYGKYKQQSNE